MGSCSLAGRVLGVRLIRLENTAIAGNVLDSCKIAQS